MKILMYYIIMPVVVKSASFTYICGLANQDNEKLTLCIDYIYSSGIKTTEICLTLSQFKSIINALNESTSVSEIMNDGIIVFTKKYWIHLTEKTTVVHVSKVSDTNRLALSKMLQHHVDIFEKHLLISKS
jgi:hypothetical protein